MWFYRLMPVILWTEHVSNDERVNKMETKRILRIRKEIFEISGTHNEENLTILKARRGESNDKQHT